MTKHHAVVSEVVHFVGTDTAPLLREIADYFEEQGDEATFIGAWDTCCGEPWQLTIQVVVTHEAEPHELSTDAEGRTLVLGPKCQTCDGKGGAPSHQSGGLATTDWRRCKTCNGTGVQPEGREMTDE